MSIREGGVDMGGGGQMGCNLSKGEIDEVVRAADVGKPLIPNLQYLTLKLLPLTLYPQPLTLYIQSFTVNP